MVKYLAERDSDDAGMVLCLGLTNDHIARMSKGNPALVDVDLIRGGVGDVDISHVVMFNGSDEEELSDNIEDWIDGNQQVK